MAFPPVFWLQLWLRVDMFPLMQVPGVCPVGTWQSEHVRHQEKHRKTAAVPSVCALESTRMEDWSMFHSTHWTGRMMSMLNSGMDFGVLATPAGVSFRCIASWHLPTTRVSSTLWRGYGIASRSCTRERWVHLMKMMLLRILVVPISRTQPP